MSHFNEVANDWDSPGKTSMMQELALKTKKILNLNKHVDILDFGTGTGLFAFEFNDHAKSITGVDVSDGMLEVFDKKAKNLDHIKSRNIDLEDEILEEQYDLIISSMAFHHLNHPQLVLKKLKKNLSNNGQIAIVDLDQEDGTFHPNNEAMGVKHFGFSKEELNMWANELDLEFNHIFINSILKNGKEYKQFLAIFKLREE
jgi:ubiquinone/menaquinone biosynthesis C-methylase UbiE